MLKKMVEMIGNADILLTSQIASRIKARDKGEAEECCNKYRQ